MSFAFAWKIFCLLSQLDLRERDPDHLHSAKNVDFSVGGTVHATTTTAVQINRKPLTNCFSPIDLSCSNCSFIR